MIGESASFIAPEPARQVELEISTRCVAGCSECPRTRAAENNDENWNSGFLSADIILKFLKQQNYIEKVNFCGAYGDAIYHPKLAEICSRIHNEMPRDISICIETNGSHRSKEWWMALAASLKQQDCVTFSIDGIGNTNAIYRAGTDWESIMLGVKTLRSFFKGSISWKWIVFSHNENQVVEAYKLSKTLKLDDFILVNSGRHYAGSQPTQSIVELEDAIRRVT